MHFIYLKHLYMFETRLKWFSNKNETELYKNHFKSHKIINSNWKPSNNNPEAYKSIKEQKSLNGVPSEINEQFGGLFWLNP